MAEIFYQDKMGILYAGDTKETLAELPKNSVSMAITSPPYWSLRNYNDEGGQLGQEHYFQDYICNLAEYLQLTWNVLKEDGTLWVNLGDTYYGSNKGSGGKGYKQDTVRGSHYKYNKGNKGSRIEDAEKFQHNELPKKSLCMIPARFAIEMQSRGWILRNQIIWHKPNAMPVSTKDRFSVDYEVVYMFSKIGKGYKFNQQLEPSKPESISRAARGWNGNTRNNSVAQSGIGKYMGTERAVENAKKGRNKRTVWSINTESKKGLSHFATYPLELTRTPILAGSNEGDLVLDPFFGSGTTAIMAERLGRRWVGIELHKGYCQEALERILNARG